MDGKILLTNTIKPLWSDMDALGHINNSRYFSYCEETRIKWLSNIGFPDVLNGKSKEGPVIINASLTFMKPCVYPEEININLFVHSPGNSSFITEYEIVSKSQPDTLFAHGSAKVVWIDYQQEKSVSLPAKIIDNIREPL